MIPSPRSSRWWIAALVAIPSVAAAQTTGSIRGNVSNAVDGASLDAVAVIATSPALQGEQIAVTEPDGSFTLSFLPPGTYTLQFELDEFRMETMEGVEVDLGQTTPVTLDMVPVALEAETIRVTAEAPTVDRGSTEVGTNMDRELLATTPSGRTYTEVLRETPGASQDAYGATVFGSTGVENTYVIEGMNTTDVGFGRAGAVMSTDFFEEIEVKTGGYMPEFGRSTGGIYNLVLRSGGNEFHGSLFSYASPGFLRADELPISRAGEGIGREDRLELDLDAGFTLGGPIIRDRLWFFVGFNPRLTTTDVSRIVQTRVDEDGDGEPDLDGDGNVLLREVSREHLDRDRLAVQFAGKLTLGLSPNHRLSAAYFGDPSVRDGVIRAPDDSRTSNGVVGTPDYYEGERRFGSHNVVLSYAAQLLQRRMELEAFAGVHTETDVLENLHDEPAVVYAYPRNLDDFEPGICPDDPGTRFVECEVSDYQEGGIGSWWDERLDRYSAGFRLTNLLGRHRLRYGFETEYKTYASTRGYSGGRLDYHYYPSTDDDPGAHELNYYAREGDDPNVPYLYDVDGHPPFTADVATLTLTGYLQDSWEIGRRFTVNGGVRWDYERLGGVDQSGHITIPDEVAPRLGVAYDPSGVGRGRFFASWGWQYESIPMDINQRSFSKEGFAMRYVDDDGTPLCLDPYYYYYYPLYPLQPADGCVSWLLLGGENSAVQHDLKGQYNEEFIVGAEYEVARHLVVGVSGVARRLMRTIEDVSPDGGYTYVIANPGEPGPGQDFPSPQRIYTGLVFSARKRLSNHSQFLTSYTLSRLEGDYPGLYSPDNDQLDPNISSQYDIEDLLPNRYGPLPGDHTHQIKFLGSYDLGGFSRTIEGLTVGLGYHAQSGSPISYLGRHPWYGRLEVFVLPRGEAGRTPWTHQLDAHVGYDIPLGGSFKLNLNAAVFNFLNFQEAIVVDQEYTTDVIAPHPRGTPLSELRNADGDPVNVNPTFGEPRLRQPPLYVRLGARVDF